MVDEIKQLEREIDLIDHELKVLFHDLDDADGKEEDSIIFDLNILQDRQLLQDFKLQQAHWRKNTSSHRN